MSTYNITVNNPTPHGYKIALGNCEVRLNPVDEPPQQLNVGDTTHPLPTYPQYSVIQENLGQDETTIYTARNEAEAIGVAVRWLIDHAEETTL